MICTARRSGSWLLAAGLEDTKIAGHPSEWFNDNEEPVWCERWGLSYPIGNYEQYLAKVIEEGRAGTDIFGVKMLGLNFKDFEGKLRTIPAFRNSSLKDIIPVIFPNTHYIRLTRRNKERQAISYYRAKSSGVWHDVEGYPLPANMATPAFDPEEIRRGEEELKDLDILWEEYFRNQNVTPLHLEYEDLAANYEKTILNVLEYIGIKEPQNRIIITPPRFKKQADSTTDEWLAMYVAYKLSRGLS